MPIDVPDVRGLPIYTAHEAKLAAIRASRTQPLEPEMLKRLVGRSRDCGPDEVFNLLTTCHMPADKEAMLFIMINKALERRKSTSVAVPDGTDWTVIDLVAAAAEGHPAIPLAVVADALLDCGGQYSGIRLRRRVYALHELLDHDKERWIREKPDELEALAEIHGRCGEMYLRVRDSARACDEFIASAKLDSAYREAAIEECLAAIARDGTDGKFVTHSGAVLTREDGDVLLVDGAPLPSLGSHQRRLAEGSAVPCTPQPVGPSPMSADPPRDAGGLQPSPEARRTVGLSPWQLALAAACITALVFAAARSARCRPRN